MENKSEFFLSQENVPLLLMTTQHIDKKNPLYKSDSKRYILSLLINDLHPKINLNLQSVFFFSLFKVISKNVRGWCVLQRYDAARQSEGQYFTQRTTEQKQNQVPNKARTTARLYHSVSDYTSVCLFFLQCLVISLIFRSQQHGLLHGKRLLCVPVVWSSKQLGELLPNDRLLLLELCPVVKQAVGVGGKRELLNGRHLGSLEAGRARHPTWGLRGQLILRCPREPVYRPPRPALRQVVRVRLASPLPLKPVVHRSIDLCGGGELLQVDGGGAALGFQLQGVFWGRPGVTGVAGGARWRLPAIGGVGVVHESLIWG